MPVEQIIPDLIIPSFTRAKSTNDAATANESTSKDLEMKKAQNTKAAFMKFKMQLKQMQIVLIDSQMDEMAFNAKAFQPYLSDKFRDKFYILTPLDVNLSFDKCIYQDDMLLPELKLVGELPLLDFKLTDVKLENIISLLTSIPYPKANDFSYLGIHLHV